MIIMIIIVIIIIIIIITVIIALITLTSHYNNHYLKPAPGYILLPKLKKSGKLQNRREELPRSLSARPAARRFCRGARLRDSIALAGSPKLFIFSLCLIYVTPGTDGLILVW